MVKENFTDDIGGYMGKKTNEAYKGVQQKKKPFAFRESRRIKK